MCACIHSVIVFCCPHACNDETNETQKTVCYSDQ